MPTGDPPDGTPYPGTSVTPYGSVRYYDQSGNEVFLPNLPVNFQQVYFTPPDRTQEVLDKLDRLQQSIEERLSGPVAEENGRLRYEIISALAVLAGEPLSARLPNNREIIEGSELLRRIADNMARDARERTQRHLRAQGEITRLEREVNRLKSHIRLVIELTTEPESRVTEDIVSQVPVLAAVVRALFALGAVRHNLAAHTYDLRVPEARPGISISPATLDGLAQTIGMPTLPRVRVEGDSPAETVTPIGASPVEMAQATREEIASALNLPADMLLPLDIPPRPVVNTGGGFQVETQVLPPPDNQLLASDIQRIQQEMREMTPEENAEDDRLMLRDLARGLGHPDDHYENPPSVPEDVGPGEEE